MHTGYGSYLATYNEDEDGNISVYFKGSVARWLEVIETIKRETKTRLYTENFSFYKKDSAIVGDKFYKVVKATQEHFDILEKERVVRYLNNLDFNILNLDVLRGIYKLIKTDKESKL